MGKRRYAFHLPKAVPGGNRLKKAITAFAHWSNLGGFGRIGAET